VAFGAAVASVVGRDPGDHGVVMGGKTDPQIALEILATMALSEDEARDHLPGVMRGLEQELESAFDQMRRDGDVLPGVAELVARLHRDPEVMQTILTGNLAANARVKLAVFGLDQWFDLDVGAYGSDDRDRTNLVPVALDKVERRYGLRLDPHDVWVVGDTARDLDCARAGGARCLIVATGRFSYQDLKTLPADQVLPDLTDTERVIGILTG
jgi:phosphoglycolate phosphatase